jgi:hypothetical protein
MPPLCVLAVMVDGIIERRVGRSNGMLKKEIPVTGLSRMLGRCGCRKRVSFAVEVFEGQFDSRRQLSASEGAGRIVTKYRILDLVKGVAK